MASDHAHFEELTALTAGRYLSDQERSELLEHLVVCADCRLTQREFGDLVRLGLPLARGEFSHFVDKMKVRPAAGVRERFLARARREGIRFSPDAEKQDSSGWPHFSFQTAGVVALAAAILVAAFYGWQVMRRSVLEERAHSQQEILRLKGENAGLTSRLAELDQQLVAQLREMGDLRSQLGNTAKTAEGCRHVNEQRGVRLEQSMSQKAQLLDELQIREKQLAESKDEIACISQLRATDLASLASYQARINEISDQLRIASATLDMERQLSAAGRDIRNLMLARQLHVVDVRDTDANGNPSEAFGRIFLTEGKSLVLYAFDLNERAVANANARFQVWGEQLGKRSPHSLGLLSIDNKFQRRWVLKINNSRLLNEIDSEFITTSVSGCSKTPDGQRLLYAYLGHRITVNGKPAKPGTEFS